MPAFYIVSYIPQPHEESAISESFLRNSIILPRVLSLRHDGKQELSITCLLRLEVRGNFFGGNLDDDGIFAAGRGIDIADGDTRLDYDAEEAVGVAARLGVGGVLDDGLADGGNEVGVVLDIEHREFGNGIVVSQQPGSGVEDDRGHCGDGIDGFRTAGTGVAGKESEEFEILTELIYGT